jgi:hypothetical protein
VISKAFALTAGRNVRRSKLAEAYRHLDDMAKTAVVDRLRAYGHPSEASDNVHVRGGSRKA